MRSRHPAGSLGSAEFGEVGELRGTVLNVTLTVGEPARSLLRLCMSVFERLTLDQHSGLPWSRREGSPEPQWWGGNDGETYILVGTQSWVSWERTQGDAGCCQSRGECAQ